MEKQETSSESSPTNTNVESTSNNNPPPTSAPTGANVEPISNLNPSPLSPPAYANAEPISYPNLAPPSYTLQQPQQFLPPTVPQFLPPTGQSMPAYPAAYYIVSPLPQQPNQQHQQLQQVVLSILKGRQNQSMGKLYLIGFMMTSTLVCSLYSVLLVGLFFAFYGIYTFCLYMPST